MNLIQLIVKNSFCHEFITLDFKEGINYIKAENEAGKSELLSMISYALFGTVGLRGKADTYKKLEVTLTFKVNLNTYKVLRSSKSVNLFQIEDKIEKILATATTPVNNLIITILGYNYDIYKVTNYCEQSESEYYNKMTKSERLQFVDKASGVEDAKNIDKYLNDRKKELKALIKSTKENLNITEVTFEVNEEYESIVDFDLYVEEISNLILSNYKDLLKVQENITLLKNMPKEPTFNFKDFTFKDLTYSTNKLYQKLKSMIHQNYQTYDVKGFADLVKDYSNNYKTKSKYLNALNTELNTNITTYEKVHYKDLEFYLTAIETNKLYEQKEKLLRQGDIECPHCLHSFPLMYKNIENYSHIKYVECPYTSAFLMSANLWYSTNKPRLLNDIKILENELVELSEIVNLEKDYIKFWNEYTEYATYLSNYSQSLKHFENSIVEYKSKIENWDLEQLEISCENLEKTSIELTALKSSLIDYKARKEHFNIRNNLFNTLSIKLLEYEKELEVVEYSLKSSKARKLEIQQKFIPSLNKKASNIVNQITSGKRYNLEITDTFDLILDTHEINLYSGSAKVVANIAFRLAYIELFYNKTFPVFIGDEIDCYFDAQRAKELHSCFEQLVKRSYQIILISHHLQEDGNIIDLEVLKGTKK